MTAATTWSNAAESVTARSARILRSNSIWAFVKPIDELAVAQAALADGRVDADDPQLAELPLPVAAIAKGIDAGADECFFGCPQQATTPADKSLHLVEETLLGLISGGTFYGTHGYLSLK